MFFKFLWFLIIQGNLDKMMADKWILETKNHWKVMRISEGKLGYSTNFTGLFLSFV